jgi:hypothetical protein
MRTSVSDVIPKDVLLEVRLGVGRVGPAEAVESREQWSVDVSGTAVHTGIAPSSGHAIWNIRRDSVDELAEGPDLKLLQRGAHLRGD